MNVIQWHDLTAREYTDSTVTSYTGGSTWIRNETAYGSLVYFVALAMSPRDIARHFAESSEPLRVQVSRY